MQVVICQNNTRALGRCCAALAHEMTHMFDYCRAKLDFTNLEHVACTEVSKIVWCLAFKLLEGSLLNKFPLFSFGFTDGCRFELQSLIIAH